MNTRKSYMLDDQDTYVVLDDAGYYAGDCQHPQGWGLSIVSGYDDGTETIYTGTLAQCREWVDRLEEVPYILDHNQASGVYRIAKLLDDDADYQGWLDGLDWDGCPSADGSDYDANVAWAEDQAYQSDGVIPVTGPNGELFLIDLSTIEEIAHV